MMCEGSSWRICTRYSPRSVSTGAMPFCSRKSLIAISSPIIDLPLVTSFASALRQMSSTMRARFLRRHRIMHVAARRGAALLELLEIEIEMRERVVLDVARLSRSASNSGSLATTARRRSTMPVSMPCSADCNCGSASASFAFSLNAGEVRCVGECHQRSPIGGASSRRPALRRRGARAPACRAAAACPPCSSGSRDRPRAACPRRSPRCARPSWSTMVLEMSGYLTQNVPPKPQHTSASCISFRSSPCTLASSLRGCALMPSSRRPEQLS